MDSRRIFVGRVATSLAGTIAVGPDVLGAADRIRVGVIGAGDRGTELTAQIRACSNMETVAFADVYRTRLDAAVRSVPGSRGYSDYRALFDDRSIDAVVIATPPHLHTAQFCDALAAGKHVYVERTMAFTVSAAKKMREAYQRDGGKHVVQVGDRKSTRLNSSHT